MKLWQKSFLTIAAAASLMIGAQTLAEEGASMDHSAHETKAAGPEDIYAPAMKKMHEDMMITPTGDPDADFIRGMIPHHQGAVEMAKIVLEKGKDEEVKRLARDVIAAQEKEIAFMQDWLKRHSY